MENVITLELKSLGGVLVLLPEKTPTFPVFSVELLMTFIALLLVSLVVLELRTCLLLPLVSSCCR